MENYSFTLSEPSIPPVTQTPPLSPVYVLPFPSCLRMWPIGYYIISLRCGIYSSPHFAQTKGLCLAHCSKLGIWLDYSVIMYILCVFSGNSWMLFSLAGEIQLYSLIQVHCGTAGNVSCVLALNVIHWGCRESKTQDSPAGSSPAEGGGIPWRRLPPCWFNRHSDCHQRLLALGCKLQEAFRPLHGYL